MSDVVRLVLLLALAGAAVTALACVALYVMDEPKRLGRALRRGLGSEPDGLVIAHGHGRAAGFSLETGTISVVWDSGAWRLVYSLDELAGAEIAVDGEVAARVHRGEARRPLDRVPSQAQEIRLRLVFDDARHPDFDLILWPAPEGRRGAPASAGEAAKTANRELARVEAIFRRPSRSKTPVVRADPPPPDDDFDDDDEDDSPI